MPDQLLLAGTFVLGGTFVLICALWQRRTPSLFAALFLSDESIAKIHAQYFFWEAWRCLRKKRYEAAVECSRWGLSYDSESAYGLGNFAIALLSMGNFAEARGLWLELLNRGDLTPADKVLYEPLRLHLRTRTLLVNNVAVADLRIALSGDDQLLTKDAEIPAKEGLMAEALNYSQIAIEGAPWIPSIRSTRGSALVVDGQIEEGLALLRDVMPKLEKDGRAHCASFIALGEFRSENLDEARKYLAQARQLDPDNVSLKLVEKAIGGHLP